MHALTPGLPSGQKTIEVLPNEVTVTLAENGMRVLTFVLPPLDDLSEMAALEHAHFSLIELSFKQADDSQKQFSNLLVEYKSKSARFAKSATLLNRVANLAALAGDLDEEARAIKQARSYFDDSFFAHKDAENLLNRHRIDEAISLVAALPPESDLYANLRMAYFHVSRREFSEAEARVRRALEIDRLDFGAQLFMGGLCLIQGNDERAIRAFRIAADSRDTSSALFCNMGVAYIRLGASGKAFAALKRSVALDPLNVNAVRLLADLAFRERRNEDAIPSLRYLVGFEQKHADIWARLARACLQIGKPAEAISALKLQGSLDTKASAVWNNLGVAYQAQGDSKKGLESFKHAMSLAADVRDRDYFLAARNVTQNLADSGDLPGVLTFAKEVIAKDVDGLCVQDDDLSDVYIWLINALSRLKYVREAQKLTEMLLQKENISPKLLTWSVTVLIAQYALTESSVDPSKELFERFESRMDELTRDHPDRRAIYLNNVAFAFAEFDCLSIADRYLSRISSAIHKDAYATATFGLIQMRRGLVERATRLYEEAFSLATSRIDKARIRQKLNIELGRQLLVSNPVKAERLLRRAAEADPGEVSLAERARKILEQLPNKH